MTASRPRYFRGCHTTHLQLKWQTKFPGISSTNAAPSEQEQNRTTSLSIFVRAVRWEPGRLWSRCHVTECFCVFVEVNKVMLPQRRGWSREGPAAGGWHLSWLVWTADFGSMYERGQCWNYSGIIGHMTLKVTIIIVPNCVATPAQQQYSPNEIVHVCIILSCVVILRIFSCKNALNNFDNFVVSWASSL